MDEVQFEKLMAQLPKLSKSQKHLLFEHLRKNKYNKTSEDFISDDEWLMLNEVIGRDDT